MFSGSYEGNPILLCKRQPLANLKESDLNTDQFLKSFNIPKMVHFLELFKQLLLTVKKSRQKIAISSFSLSKYLKQSSRDIL